MSAKVYGPEHPDVATDANKSGRSSNKGDLDAALTYAQRELAILNETYGPDHPLTKATASNVEQIRRQMKDYSIEWQPTLQRVGAVTKAQISIG